MFALVCNREIILFNLSVLTIDRIQSGKGL
jgi:hypothetical protein